jgi:hypothetical protein
MTKQQFKEQDRQRRIAANDGMGIRIGKLMKGEIVPTYNNSAIWALREQIASEVAPEIRKLQLAWING